MANLPEQVTSERLQRLIARGDVPEIERFFDSISPMQTAWMVSRLTTKERVRLLGLLEPAEAAEVLLDLPDEQAADLLEETSAQTAAAIVSELPAHEQADILAEVEDDEAQAILESMDEEDAAVTRSLLGYPEDTAGGIMTTQYLAFHDTNSVKQVVDDLHTNAERYSDYEVQYAYVISPEGRLVGVLQLRDLLLTPPDTPIQSIMIRNPFSVEGRATLEDLEQFRKEHPALLGVPVTRPDGTLIGIVTRSAVMEAAGERANAIFLSISGIVGGEEFRSMPFIQRSTRRLSWLAPNIFLNIVAASVIALYQDTLHAVIALAVFLPIISDMSGCSGNQAVAVSIRELSLGLIRPNEFLRVVLKEGVMGLANGAVLGAMLGAVAILWKGNLYLGAVVGGALALNTTLSVLLGGLVPMVLRYLRVDPALASGPILTTVTDMCGFFLVLGLATLALPHLVG